MNSSSQLGLDLVHDAAEGSLVVHCEVGQHLAVDLDGSLLQAVGELAVCQAQFTCSGVDTGNPQLAEHALLVAAVTVGILPSLHYRLFGDTEDVTAATTETLGKGENFLVTGTGRYTTFDARHVCTPCSSVIKGQRWAAFVRSSPCWSHAHSLHHAGGACSWWS